MHLQRHNTVIPIELRIIVLRVEFHRLFISRYRLFQPAQVTQLVSSVEVALVCGLELQVRVEVFEGLLVAV